MSSTAPGGRTPLADHRDSRPVALITGGSSGIGLAAARLFLARGHRVVLGGRDAERLQRATTRLVSEVSTAGAGDVVAAAGELADSTTAGRLIQAGHGTFGRVDVLVNNAGMFAPKPFVDVTPGEVEGYVSANLLGTFRVTQAFVRQLLADGRAGSIVNITTTLLSHAIGGFPATAPLVSKGGVRALTNSLAAELAPHGIRVNEVAPGIVRTPLHDPAQVDGLGGLAVLNRVGEAEELAEAIFYLATAAFVTGHVLDVDGGFVTTRP